jgi:hypothetical protein
MSVYDQNKTNHNDIIDAEFVVENSSKVNSAKNSENFNTENSIDAFDYNYKNQNYSQSHNFAWEFSSQNIKKFKRMNLLTLLLLSPFLIVILLFTLFIFLIAFILFMPKMLKFIKIMRLQKRNPFAR